jgi:hypothetical protein
MNVSQAIKKAERILPGVALPNGGIDPRWQAIMKVGEFIESHPEEVWQFTARWGKSRNSDLRAAVATCLLEHILEYHFAEFFPRTNELAQKSSLFADTFSLCAKFGQSELPENAKLFDQLKKSISRRLRRRK